MDGIRLKAKKTNEKVNKETKKDSKTEKKSKEKKKKGLKLNFLKRKKKKKKDGSKKPGPKKSGSKKRHFLGLPMKKALLLWTGIVLLVLFGVLFLVFRDPILLALPGFYENRDYNTLTVEKNDLIDENARLLKQNNKLDEELSDLGGSVEDFEIRIEKNKEILSNLETIETNMEAIVEYDDEFASMRLPYNVSRYVQLSKELDETRKELVVVYKDYINARIDMTILNRKRAEFDVCMNDINWSGDDKAIAEGIDGCRTMIEEMLSQVQVMEDNYKVELAGLTNYFTLLASQWEASSDYYKALDANDYQKANEYDSVFAEKKRAISEIDLDVFNEFDNKVTNDFMEKFKKLSQEEIKLEDKADKWYKENLI